MMELKMAFPNWLSEVRGLRYSGLYFHAQCKSTKVESIDAHGWSFLFGIFIDRRRLKKKGRLRCCGSEHSWLVSWNCNQISKDGWCKVGRGDHRSSLWSQPFGLPSILIVSMCVVSLLVLVIKAESILSVIRFSGMPEACNTKRPWLA